MALQGLSVDMHTSKIHGYLWGPVDFNRYSWDIPGISVHPSISVWISITLMVIHDIPKYLEYPWHFLTLVEFPFVSVASN